MKKNASTAKDLEAFNYADYLKSEAWNVRRQWKLDSAGHRCQVCNSSDKLQVHHRTYDRIGQEKEFDLVVLCDNCHEIYHKVMVPPPPFAEPERPPVPFIPNPARWGDDANRAAEIARELQIVSGDGAMSLSLLEEKRMMAVRRANAAKAGQ